MNWLILIMPPSPSVIYCAISDVKSKVFTAPISKVYTAPIPDGTSPSLIRAGTTNTLENHATTYPVTRLGHVRVLYIHTNRNDVGEYDL